jgi:hypothetical protein
MRAVFRRSFDTLVRNYTVEAVASVFAFIGFTPIFYILRDAAQITEPMKIGLSVLSAGSIFIVGTVYGRQKDRREAKRTRALALFAEWHSVDIRTSRIFVSHFLAQRADDDPNNLNALSKIERDAGAFRKMPPPPSDMPAKNDLEDPNLVEFHFFRIYQFFERWTLLLEHGDIDPRDSHIYMWSYTDWYLKDFVISWLERENDEINSNQLDAYG